MDRSRGLLAGKHAVVTGASRGIGRALAQELCRMGAHLTLIARSAAGLEETRGLLTREPGQKVEVATVDVTAFDALREALANAVKGLGTCHVLINNAGAAEGIPFLKTGIEAWQRAMDLNVTSAFVASQAVLPGMLDAQWGRIINVASLAGLKGVAYASAYSASKHALIGLTRSLALECARKGVTVNAVCPGYVDTPMTVKSIENIVGKSGRSADEVKRTLTSLNPMGRFVTAEEVATVVGWLCQSSAAAINGVALPVAGGEFG